MAKINIKKIEKALKEHGYANQVVEVRKGRKFDKVITSTRTIFLTDGVYLRDYPSKKIIKKVN